MSLLVQKRKLEQLDKVHYERARYSRAGERA
jgi:hypothetical protein